MAHELLTGRLPFNDKRNLYNPALSAVLRSILTDKLDFTQPCWKEISPEGIDFVKCVLPENHHTQFFLYFSVSKSDRENIH